MNLHDELRRMRRLFPSLRFYEHFEHGIVLVLTLAIVAVVASATRHLVLSVLALLLQNKIDPANQEVLQSIFGMALTVTISMEIKRLLLFVVSRQESVVRVRSIVSIALLAVP